MGSEQPYLDGTIGQLPDTQASVVTLVTGADKGDAPEHLLLHDPGHSHAGRREQDPVHIHDYSTEQATHEGTGAESLLVGTPITGVADRDTPAHPLPHDPGHPGAHRREQDPCELPRLHDPLGDRRGNRGRQIVGRGADRWRRPGACCPCASGERNAGSRSRTARCTATRSA